MAEPMTLTSHSAELPTLSLLHPTCIQLFEDLDRDWRDVRIDSGPRVNLEQSEVSLLNQCGIVTLGDLCHVTPISLLALYVGRGSRYEERTTLWQTALRSVNTGLSSILRNVIFHLLTEALEHAIPHQPTQANVALDSDAQSEACNSLFIDFPVAFLAAVSISRRTHDERFPRLVGGEEVSSQLMNALDAPLLTTVAIADLGAQGCDLNALKVSDLSLSSRTYNLLMRRCNVRTLCELVQYCPGDFLTFRQFGPTAYIEIVSRLRNLLEPWIIASNTSETRRPDAALEIAQNKGMEATLTLPADEALRKDHSRDPLLTPHILRILDDEGVIPLDVQIEPLLAKQVDDVPKLALVLKAFKRAHIKTVRECLNMSVDQLFGLRYFGIGCFSALHAFLRAYFGDQLQKAVNQAKRSQHSTQIDDAPAKPTLMSSSLEGAPPSIPGTIDFIAPELVDFVVGLMERYGIAWRHAQIRITSQSKHALSPALANRTLGDILAQPSSIETTELPPDENLALTRIITKRVADLLAHEVVFLTSTANDQLLNVVEDVTIESLLCDMFSLAGFSLPSRHLVEVSLPRELEILLDRQGLFDDQPKTLAEVGERLGRTRERARQLENRARVLVYSDEMIPYRRALSSLVSAAIRALGGVATLLTAAARISAQISFGDLRPSATVRLLAQWCDDITMTDDPQLLVAFPFSSDDALGAWSAAKSVLASYPTSTPLSDLIMGIQQRLKDSIVADHPDFISAIVGVIDADALPQQYNGPIHGAHLDRLVYTLREFSGPAHFTKIAERYRQRYIDDQSQSDHATHALLGRFPEVFVRVGHGIFALAETGYDPRINNVSALLESILRESSSPVHVYDIVHRAMAKYRWQDGSILAGLNNHAHIRSFGHGFYGLDNRHYGTFDPALAYMRRFNYRLPGREQLVTGVYKSPEGNPVVLVRLTALAACSSLTFSSQTMREMFPRSGQYPAHCSKVGDKAILLQLRCIGNTIEGLGSWLRSLPACPRDALVIERRDIMHHDEASWEYQITFAPASKADALVQALRLP